MLTLSLVIPFYNEGERIKKTLSVLSRGFSCPGVCLERIVFVDDGSLDGASSLVRSFMSSYAHLYDMKLISYSPNKGRGYAVRQGVLACLSSDYILYTDADFSIPLANLTSFVSYMKSGYDLLFGSKKKPGAKQLVKRSLLRNIVGYGHSLVASLVLGVFVWDYQGGFKIFSSSFAREVFPYLTVDRWGFDMEVVFLAKKFAFKTIELPVFWGHIEKDSKVKLIRDILRSLREMRTIKANWSREKYSIFPIPYISLSS